ncbi:MAG: hypothetical protein HYT37_00660 [Candidatus Sungbacteria bacterium]|nr:hypothetical protein [Candidatus Sungbacteria bacterium]
MHSILDDYYLPEEVLGVNFANARKIFDFVHTQFPPKNFELAKGLLKSIAIAISWLEVSFYEQPHLCRDFGAVADYIRNMRRELEKTQTQILMIGGLNCKSKGGFDETL